MPADLKNLIKNSLTKAKKEGKLQSAVQKSLKNIAEKGINIEDMIVGGLAKSFAKLPGNVGELIESYVGEVPESGRWTSEAVMEGFNMLSLNIREKVIKKIADDKSPEAREWAMYMFIKNYDNFPRNAREEILIKFSDDCDVNVKSGALLMVAVKFSQLSENVQKLLTKFASDKDPEMRLMTAYALAWKFKEISPFGNLLKNLADDESEDVRKAVAHAVTQNFWNLDCDIQKILVKLSRDESIYVRKGIANLAVKNKWLPDYMKILENLNKDEKMRSYLIELTDAYSL